ncbi:hypothetical protein EAG_13446 [Camponotus floridanus]|uniref:Uncharacterized protein n=2 Tax=Camponotus floridanus TaxID=104421 RepID=E2AXH2_CAMFO|nr:hypothetical protein EAG_13446 [Camponotus floridanus]
MEHIKNQDVSEGKLSLVSKKRTGSKRNVSVKMDNPPLTCKTEAMQQQMTNVKASCDEIITKSSKADCICIPVYTLQSENFATLSEKNVKEIKDVRKQLKQNKNEKEKEKKSKKKLKNIRAAQQQMTTVKMSHNEIIIKPKADCIRVPVYNLQSENFAPLFEKNVKEVRDVRKKLEQNKNEDKKEKKSKKKLKNIEAAQQQMITTVEMSHNEIIIKPKACVRVYTPQSKNFVTLSEKNDKKIKYVPEKFVQNKEELKNAKVIQEQITTNTKTAGVEMTLVPNKIDDKKCELMKQDAHLRTNRLYVIEKMKQKMNENDVSSYTKNTSKISKVVKVSRKDYITLPSVTLQMIRMKEEDYHITPPPINFAGKSDKSMKLLKKTKEYDKDSLINLMEDFDSIKNMINKTIIKMWELLEDMKTNDL